MTKQQKIMLLLVLAVVSSGAVYYATTQDKSSVPQEQVAISNGNTENTNPAPTQNPTPTTQGNGQTQPGTVATKSLTQDVTYQTPEEGNETIHVSIVVDTKGVIQDVTFSYDTPHKRESRNFLASFEKSFSKDMVVGKSVNGLTISRVGGASLTTKAFNKALSDAATSLNG
jgi:hypothetical protein